MLFKFLFLLLKLVLPKFRICTLNIVIPKVSIFVNGNFGIPDFWIEVDFSFVSKAVSITILYHWLWTWLSEECAILDNAGRDSVKSAKLGNVGRMLILPFFISALASWSVCLWSRLLSQMCYKSSIFFSIEEPQ